jgi:hypothetical protein
VSATVASTGSIVVPAGNQLTCSGASIAGAGSIAVQGVIHAASNIDFGCHVTGSGSMNVHDSCRCRCTTHCGITGGITVGASAALHFTAGTAHSICGNVALAASSQLQVFAGAALECAQSTAISGAGTVSVAGSLAVNAATSCASQMSVTGAVNIATSAALTMQTHLTATAGAVFSGAGQMTCHGNFNHQGSGVVQVACPTTCHGPVAVASSCTARFGAGAILSAGGAVSNGAILTFNSGACQIGGAWNVQSTSQIIVAAAAQLTTCASTNIQAAAYTNYQMIVQGRFNCNHPCTIATNCDVPSGGCLNIAAGQTLTVATQATLRLQSGASIIGAGVLSCLGILLNLNICILICLGGLGLSVIVTDADGGIVQAGNTVESASAYTPLIISLITLSLVAAIILGVATVCFIKYRRARKTVKDNQPDADKDKLASTANDSTSASSSQQQHVDVELGGPTPAADQTPVAPKYVNVPQNIE